jgi:cytochrome b pre-mRNA-processing protein 3
MISFAFRRSRRDPRIAALYGTIVAQARHPAFYRDYGVPDTVSARIDMIIMHLVLVLRRLHQTPESGKAMGQELFDMFCNDMDDNFREMGVGDLKVPKEMRRIAEAFYGRAKIYDAALDGGDAAALASALGRNVFGTPDLPLGARRLAAYMKVSLQALNAREDAMLLGGELAFCDPASEWSIDARSG